MNRLMRIMALPLIAAVGYFGATIATGQAGSDSPAVVDNIFSRARIVKLNDDIFRFDTATGELFRFRGTLSGANARGSFLAVADPVLENTSGFLDIQQVDDAFFLIDVVNGDTWILRQRGRNNSAWIPLDIRD